MADANNPLAGEDDSPPSPPPVPSASPRHKRGWKWLLVNLLKIVIAVAGIGLVVKNISWNDTAVLPAGTEVRTLVLTKDVEVTVLKEEPSPPVLDVAFPANIEVDEPMPRGTQRKTIDLAQRDDFQFSREIGLPVDFFKAPTEGASRDVVHRGLQSILAAASARWYLLLAAWGILVIPFLVTAIRWRGLMRPQGIEMPLLKCLQLTFVGQFYSIILPGITGGDLVKIVYAARLTGSKTKSLITVLLDRMIGLIALMSIGAVAAGWQLWANRGGGAALADNTLQNVFILIIALLAMFAIGATIYFSRRLRKLIGLQWFIETFAANPGEPTLEQHAHLERLYRAALFLVFILTTLAGATASVVRWCTHLPWAEHNAIMLLVIIIALAAIVALCLLALLIHGKVIDRLMPLLLKLVGAVIHVDEVLHTYRGHFGLLAWAFAISLISQLTLPLSAWLSGLAFGIQMNVGYYLAYVPVAILAASLPISPPQGLGFLEYVFNHLFARRGLANASQAFALTQAVRFLPMLWNLVGVYWVLRGKFSRHAADEESTTEPVA